MNYGLVDVSVPDDVFVVIPASGGWWCFKKDSYMIVVIITKCAHFATNTLNFILKWSGSTNTCTN